MEKKVHECEMRLRDSHASPLLVAVFRRRIELGVSILRSALNSSRSNPPRAGGVGSAVERALFIVIKIPLRTNPTPTTAYLRFELFLCSDALQRRANAGRVLAFIRVIHQP
jgi:hypothetical protein